MVSQQNMSDGQTTAAPPSSGRLASVEVGEAHTLESRHLAPVGSFVRWGPIIAGSLMAISFVALSASLGALVSAYTGPRVDLGTSVGWGAGIWTIVTSVLAFALGGYLCTALTSAHSRGNALAHGCAVWALTLPLLTIILALVAAAQATSITHEAVPMFAFTIGGGWTLFLSLLFGLGAAGYGGAMGFRKRQSQARAG